MTALAVCGLLSVVAWLAYLRERDVRRHAWRVELLSLRAAAWKAEEVETLKQRLMRLELRQGLKP